jgi:hypothetical protein
MKGFLGLTAYIPAFREEEESTQQIHASWVFPFQFPSRVFRIT